MRIAIIGTGNVGQALGGSFVRAGHEVTFAARDAAKTRQVAGKLGAAAGASPAEAASAAEIVVLAVPFSEVEGVAGELGSSVSGRVVVDVTNPLKPDMSGLATAGGPSAAERVASLLPGARVVKAFNTLFASVQGNPDAHGQMVDGFFAADDDEARAKAAELIRSIGLRPVDVGPLANARELEALAFLNIRLQVQAGGDWRSAFVLLGAPQKATHG